MKWFTHYWLHLWIRDDSCPYCYKRVRKMGRTEWWGRLALEVDAAVGHRIQSIPHLPGFIYNLAYRFCCWAVQWDELKG